MGGLDRDQAGAATAGLVVLTAINTAGCLRLLLDACTGSFSLLVVHTDIVFAWYAVINNAADGP